jgi:glycosyltransferase involved in cell wall biosynthesis
MNEFAQKPKIFIFLTAYLPLIGGAELAVKEITDRLADDFDFVLFTARFSRVLPAREKIGAVEVHRLGLGLGFDKYLLPILGYFKAGKLIKDSKFQIPNSKFLLWGMMASFGSIAAYFVKRLNPDLKFLLTLQEGDQEEYLISGRFGLMGFWLRRLVRKADFIQAISQYLKNLAVKAGQDASKTQVVPNGVDFENFSRRLEPNRVKELRIRLGLPTGKPIIITASRLVRKNGIDILIRALINVPEARLLIAGSGPQEKELRNLAQKLKKERMIHWLGSVSHKKLAEFLAISHVFARPSRSEGLGSAFLEAMACGLAVVATNVGGIPDFLIHQKTGLFCKIEDPEDLAFQIRLLLYNRELRENIAGAGQKLVFQNYSWDKVAGSMRQIFLSLAKL